MYRGLLLLPHHDSKIFPCEGSHSHENISTTKVGNVCLSPLPSQKKEQNEHALVLPREHALSVRHPCTCIQLLQRKGKAVGTACLPGGQSCASIPYFSLQERYEGYADVMQYSCMVVYTMKRTFAFVTSPASRSPRAAQLSPR